MVIVKQLIASKDTIIDFGKVFLEVFVDNLKIVASIIMDGVKWFNALSESNKKLIGGFVGTAAAIGLIVAPLFLMAGILSWNTAAVLDGVAALMKYSGKITGLIKTQGLLNGVLKKVTLRFAYYKMQLDLAGGATGLFQDRLFLLGRTMYELPKRFMGFLTHIPARFSFSMSKFATTLIYETIPAIVATTISLAPIIIVAAAITAAMVILYVAVRDNWRGIADVVKDSVGVILDLIKPLIDAVYNVIGTLTGLFDAFKSGTEIDIMEAIGSVLGGIVNLILSIPKVMFNTLAKWQMVI